jgi:hypothetical protein
VPVSIEGFSRGGGPAVALSNELSARGMAASSGIQTYLIDPYMGSRSNNFESSSVGAHVYSSSRFSWVRPAGPLIGLGREVFQIKAPVSGPTYPIMHGQMDSYSGGVLSLIDQQILGN